MLSPPSREQPRARDLRVPRARSGGARLEVAISRQPSNVAPELYGSTPFEHDTVLVRVHQDIDDRIADFPRRLERPGVVPLGKHRALPI